ncbi:MAG: hypothetical protein IJ863_08660 [Spirochaetales bacterium]|nr:hypothetical protein [Spirochaetales bacterium]
MRKKTLSFSNFHKSLSEQDALKVDSYLRTYREHLDMDAREERLLLDDAKAALMYLVNSGVSLDDAAERLSSANLGGFYAHQAQAWYPLDDAAKIYPLSMRFGNMPMFRLSCYLNGDVVPEILQMALTFTIKRFPSFATIVRKGVFWHYLDSVKRRFPVMQDKGIPCHPMKVSSIGSQSFKVLYYRNRISAEFFHVLTDGTGGMAFLKALVCEYLHLLGAPQTFDVNVPAPLNELSNDFERLCPNTKEKGGLAGPAALQMSGKLSKQTPCKVVHLVYDTERLLKLTHSMGVTVTAFMLSLMFLANRSATETSRGKIQIQVPVNMRKFFPQSMTVRNFAMYCSIDLSPEEVDDLDHVAAKVASQLGQKATFQELSKMMTQARKLVRALRFVPLAIKSPVAKIVYGFLGDSRFSNTLSNLGVVKMPEELKPYIQGFDFVLGTCVVSRASCSMVSYGNETTLSISKITKDPSFEERIIALSRQLGLDPAVKETSIYE